MTESKGDYTLESTGRVLNTHGCGDTLSVSGQEMLVAGYDCHPEVNDEFHIQNFTMEERREIAIHMIKKWSAWAGIEEEIYFL